MSYFPNEVVERVEGLGYHVINVVALYKAWSVVALKGERKFNVQLSKDGLGLISVHLLRYRFNMWGSRVASVDRILVEHKDSAEVNVI